jgi:PAS domain S-box-containing protein
VASEAEARLVLALEAAELGTWTWDMAAGTTVWDTRLEQLHGLEPGGFGGTYEDWLAAMHPADRDECLARVERALANPGPYLLLHRTIWPDGTVRWLECRGSVTVDEAGTPTGTIGVAIDVTDREDRGAVVAEQLAQERSVVEALQHALLPSELPTVPGVSVAARYVPASGPAEIGGDWYAVVPLEGRSLGLAIGDVAGHGLGAVADMADARFSARALALTEPAPERVLDRLDEVVRVFDDNVLITALYGVIDPGARTWTYAAAGHTPAVLRTPDGDAKLLDARNGPPLNCGATYHSHRVPLEPGARIVLYTDGLVERRDEGIDDGLARLRAACAGGPSEPDALCDHLLRELLGRRGSDDDVALLVVALD